jgi:hypothetical protein
MFTMLAIGLGAMERSTIGRVEPMRLLNETDEQRNARIDLHECNQAIQWCDNFHRAQVRREKAERDWAERVVAAHAAKIASPVYQAAEAKRARKNLRRIATHLEKNDE